MTTVVVLLVMPSQTLIFLAQRDCIFLILDAGMASTVNMNLKKGIRNL
jgi:hypothetical protein